MSKFEIKLSILGVTATIIGVLWSIFVYLNPNDSRDNHFTIINSKNSSETLTTTPIPSGQSKSVVAHAPKAHLTISATGSEVVINESKSGTPYSGGIVSSTGAKQPVYLPKGQLLVVNLSGTGSSVYIASSVSEQVSVNNTGTGADVSYF